MANGDVYEGHSNDVGPHGEGKMTFATGDVYEGSFANAKMHGHGKFSYAAGGSYEGEFVEGKKSGTCVMTYANGDRSQYLDLTFRFRHVSGAPFPADGENTEAAWFELDALPPLDEEMRDRLVVALGDGPTLFD